MTEAEWEMAQLLPGTPQEAAAMMKVFVAVLGDHAPEQRKAILVAWAKQIEAQQGHESNLSVWIKAIACSLDNQDTETCNEALYPDPDYDDSLPDWADFYPTRQDYIVHEHSEILKAERGYNETG